MLMRVSVLLLLILLEPSYAQTVHWERVPIAIALPIGTERLVHFPSPVTVTNTKTTLTTKSLRLMNNNGTLYFLAHQAFAPARLKVALSQGPVVFVDITATSNGSNEPVTVTVPLKENRLSPWAQTLTALRTAIAYQHHPGFPLPVWMQPMTVPAHLPKDLGLPDGCIALWKAQWRLPNGMLSVLHVINHNSHPVRLSLPVIQQARVLVGYPRRHTLAAYGNTQDATDWFILTTP